MFRLQFKKFSTSAVFEASEKKKGLKQGFSRHIKNSQKTPTKKIGPGSMHKKWNATVTTSRYNEKANVVELPVFRPNCITNQVVKFSPEQYKFLYRLGSFKKDQLNELFHKPITYTREETTKKFLELLENDKNKKFIITGESGVGKSSLLAQVHAHALEKKAFVINFSHPDFFLNGRNDFFKDGDIYVQPMYLKMILSKIKKANAARMLSSIKITKNYKFSTFGVNEMRANRTVKLLAGSNSLYDLLLVKTVPQDRGHQFQAVIDEITSQPLVPVYFTVDNFSRILTGPFSAYKNVENKNIHLLKLQIGKIIMDIVSGTIKFRNKKSCVVLAISGVDRTNRTLSIALGKRPHDSYITRYHYEPIFAEIMQKGCVKEFEVAKFSKKDVETLLDYYSKANILLDRDQDVTSTPNLIDQKYFLSGNGNPRELLKSITLYPF